MEGEEVEKDEEGVEGEEGGGVFYYWLLVNE